MAAGLDLGRIDEALPAAPHGQVLREASVVVTHFEVKCGASRQAEKAHPAERADASIVGSASTRTWWPRRTSSAARLRAGGTVPPASTTASRKRAGGRPPLWFIPWAPARSRCA